MKEIINNIYHDSTLPADSDILVKVEGVSKKFCRDLKKSLWYGFKDIVNELIPSARAAEGHSTLRAAEFWSVKNVSFELRRGECLGLIGRNGAGKTTLLKMLNGLIKPDQGRIEIRGRIGALIALGAGFNPILTGRENIYVNASVLGLSKREIEDKLEEIIEFAEIGEFIDSPVQTYSSGMQVRLGFAVATALEPDVLLLDEVLAIGDAAFRSKCYHRIGKLLRKCAVIFVSHDSVQTSRICDFCLYLKNGEMLALGRTQDVLGEYLGDNRPLRVEPSIVLHPSVKHFKCVPSKTHICWGELFNVTLEIDLADSVRSGLSLLALLDGEASVVQSDFTQQFNDSIQNGREVQLTIGPLHLREGEYGLAVTVLDESKKGTLVHAIHCATIQFKGPKGYGVIYQAACTRG